MTLPNSTTSDQLELTIVMPCLNEAETLATCIRKAREGLATAQVRGEVLVADNGSTDSSQEIAQHEGARVVNVPQRGYGAALRTGITAAHSKYILMADSDDSYDLRDIKGFVDKLRDGYQVVMGSRLKGRILPGAMPPLHRWIGNPILTLLGNILFGTRISDYHCGMRAFDRQAIENLHLQTRGMEFATEMVAKAALNHLHITEIPITYYPDGRSRKPHLRTWRDGWRHLTFMLLLSPNWVYLLPGLLLTVVGGLLGAALLPGPLTIGAVNLDVHTLLVCGIAVIVGVQILIFGLTARFFATNLGILPQTKLTRSIQHGFPLSAGLIAGTLLFLLALLPIIKAVQLWVSVDFGHLNYEITLRWLIPGLTLAALGVEIFFASFVMSLLNYAQSTNAD